MVLTVPADDLDYVAHPLHLDLIVSKIQEGEMPPAVYLPMHPSAQLSAAEKQQLITGLQNSLK